MQTHGLHYGSLSVPARAQHEVDAAFEYLARDPVERSLIERLERSRTPHRIAINRRGDDAYLPWSHTIRWDPYSALRTTSGGRQSPALGLGHELDHAAENARTYDRYQDIDDPYFDTAEERRVILGSERHAARTLHEGTRIDHDGMLYRVGGPTLR
jgi:hypothetical protein